jgi:cytochrome c-type biogenesis protein CcmH/NrfG
MRMKQRTRRASNQPAQVDLPVAGNNPGVVRSLTIGAILAVTFLVFYNSTDNGFTYDDRTQVLQNQILRSFSNLPTALTKEVWFWRALQDEDPSKQEGPTTPYYRPMFTIFQMACWSLFPAVVEGTPVEAPMREQHAWWWHLVNILTHLLAAYLAFLVLEKVTGDLRLSAIATMLFAVHPLRSESVAWVCGITDPFLAALLLSSFYFYLRFRESGQTRLLATSLGLFLLGAFAKEPAVALPVFIAAFELFVANRDKSLTARIKPALLFSLMFFAMSAAYFAMRYSALGFVLNDIKYTNYAFVNVLMTIPLVIWKYIGLLFWPVNLSLFHATPLVKSPFDVRFILSLIGLVALAAALWPLRKSTSARFAILWFGIHLLPVLNLSAFGQDFMVQERYVYTSSIGFSLLIAMGLAKIPLERWFLVRSRAMAQAVTAILLVAVLSGKTFSQNPVWNSDDDLWSHGVEVASDQKMPYYILGHHELKHQRMRQAIDCFERYMELEPNNLIVITNLASAHLVMYEAQVASKVPPDRAHIDRAIGLCDKGLNTETRNAALWDTLGRAYTYDTELRNYARARSCFTQALKISPEMMLANLHIGFTYLKEGDFDTALQYFAIAREQQPEFADTYKFIAHAYFGKERYEEAADNVSKYLDLQPKALDASKERQFLEEIRTKMMKTAPAKS